MLITKEMLEQARKEAKAWAFSELAGLRIVNKETQWTILLSKSGLKHSLGLYRQNKEFEYEALCVIQQLPIHLEQAFGLRIEPDRTNQNLTNVYRFRTEYFSETHRITAGIVQKEQTLDNPEKVFYDFHIIRKETFPTLPGE